MLAFKKEKEQNEPILYQEYLEKQKEKSESKEGMEEEKGEIERKVKIKQRIFRLLPYAAVIAVGLILGGKIVMDSSNTGKEESAYKNAVIASSKPDAQRLDVSQLTMSTTSGDSSSIETTAVTEETQEQWTESEQSVDDSDEMGKIGMDSKEGEDRNNGLAGRDGKDGADGLNGRDGKDGEAGRNGKNGVNGKDGAAGRNGENGIDGKNGADGKGAYQLAAEMGYTGTEKEFMELLSTLYISLNNMQTTIDDTTDTVDTLSCDLLDLNDQVSECFQSVSDGKGLLASTLTDKGVDTAADATFGTINNNILEMYTQAFAAGVDSIEGKSANVIYEFHNHVGVNGNITNDTSSSQLSDQSGGCYTKAVLHSHETSCINRCNRDGDLLRKGKEGNYYRWYYNCPVHGEFMQQALHEDDGSSGRCTWTGPTCGKDGQIVGYTVGCEMVEGQIVSATVNFN